MSTLTTPEPMTTRRRSRATLFAVAAGAAVLVAGVAVALALFQPWKLWVDEKVDEAAPAGARVITITPTTAAPAAPTTIAPAAPSAPSAPATPAPASTIVPPTTAPPAASMFVSLDHTTRGNVVLLADAARQRFLRFEELDTSNGPDLKVYLSTNPIDGPEGQFDDDFVDLGRLQGNVGNQNYAIPADVDLARFRSVVIWCDRFNSAFGAAALS
jgi:hypothetical protein